MKITQVLKAVATAGALALLMGSAALAATLQLHNGGDPVSLDPHKVDGDWENRVLGDFLEGLVSEDASAEPIPGQAESWTISDDRLVYTFKLRADAVWSDGVPVTSGDFVFAFQRLMDPANAFGYAYLQFPIKNAAAINGGTLPITDLGVKAVDDKTLEITLEGPTPYFLGALTHYTGWPIPKHVFDKVGDDFAKVENLIANGPYKVDEWVPGAYVHSVKNDTYYDAANVKIDDVFYHVLEDDTAALNRYRAGEFDILTAYPSDQYQWLQDNLPGQARVTPYLGVYYYVMNQTKPPFTDVNVRKALSMAIERNVIANDINGTGVLPSYGIVPPGTANYEGQTEYKPDWSARSYEENIAEAKALMEAAGFTEANPLKTTIRYNESDLHQRIAVAIQGMWSQIHVQAELINAGAVGAHYTVLEEGGFDVGRAAWQYDYNDPSNGLELLKGGTGNNYGRYLSPTYDGLLAKAAAEIDLNIRAGYLGEAEKVLVDDTAVISFFWNTTRGVVSPKILGYVDNVKDVHRTRWLSKSE